MTKQLEKRCRVGLDLVMIDEVSEAVERMGDRYLHRIYTPHELECCTGEPSVAAAGLAARFAAKEATIKVLRPTGAQPEWKSIEVVRSPSGACDIRLNGEAARMARMAGIDELSLSLSHDGPVAGAVVVATSEGPPARRIGHGKVGGGNSGSDTESVQGPRPRRSFVRARGARSDRRARRG